MPYAPENAFFRVSYLSISALTNSAPVSANAFALSEFRFLVIARTLNSPDLSASVKLIMK
jgi:hypothetical protein